MEEINIKLNYEPLPHDRKMQWLGRFGSTLMLLGILGKEKCGLLSWGGKKAGKAE